MSIINIEVRGGVAYVTLASEPVFVRIEDYDCNETEYWRAQGVEVYELEDRAVEGRIDEALEALDLKGDLG